MERMDIERPSTGPTELKKLVPPVFQFRRSKIATAYVGATTRSWQQFSSTNNTGTQSVQFNILAPSRDVVIRDNILVQYFLEVAMTGTPIGSGSDYTLFQSAADCPRAMPVARSTSTITAQIGNSQVSVQNLNEYIDVLSRYYLKADDRNERWGTFPNQLDPTGPGRDLRSVDPGTYKSYTGCPKSPFHPGFTGQSNRCEYPVYYNPQKFTSNATNTQYAQFTSVEPLLGLSPFGQNSISSGAGFWSVSTINLTINLSSTKRWWSHDASKLPGTTTFAYNFYATPICLVEFLTPPDALAPWNPNAKIAPNTPPLQYPMVQLMQFPQPTTKSMNPGETWTQTINNIQTSSCPSSLLLFARPTAGQALSSDTREVSGTDFAPDNYAGLQRTSSLTSTSGPTNVTNILKMTFDNNPAQLTDLNLEQIYNIQCENELKDTSLTEFHTFGGIIKLVFDKDLISKNKSVVTGTSGSWNIQAQVSWQNNWNVPLTFDCWAILVLDGYFTIAPNGNGVDVGSITESEVRSAQLVPMKPMGSGMFGNVLDVVATLANPMAMVSPMMRPSSYMSLMGQGLYMDAPKNELVPLNQKRKKYEGEYNLH